jgi:hypothetical protein
MFQIASGSVTDTLLVIADTERAPHSGAFLNIPVGIGSRFNLESSVLNPPGQTSHRPSALSDASVEDNSNVHIVTFVSVFEVPESLAQICRAVKKLWNACDCFMIVSISLRINEIFKAQFRNEVSEGVVRPQTVSRLTVVRRATLNQYYNEYTLCTKIPFTNCRESFVNQRSLSAPSRTVATFHIKTIDHRSTNTQQYLIMWTEFEVDVSWLT